MTDTQSKNISEGVTFFLTSKEKKENILENSSVYEKHIINQNEVLFIQNRDLSDKNKELSCKIEDMESYEDRSDNRTNTMKGLMKNFHEMDKWRQEISDNQENILLNVNKDMKAFTYKARYHLRLLQALLLFSTSMCFEFLETKCFITVFCLSLFVTAFQESTLLNLPRFEYHVERSRIKEINIEVNKAIKANDYIHEFLDQQ